MVGCVERQRSLIQLLPFTQCGQEEICEYDPRQLSILDTAPQRSCWLVCE